MNATRVEIPILFMKTEGLKLGVDGWKVTTYYLVEMNLKAKKVLIVFWEKIIFLFYVIFGFDSSYLPSFF